MLYGQWVRTMHEAGAILDEEEMMAIQPIANQALLLGQVKPIEQQMEFSERIGQASKETKIPSIDLKYVGKELREKTVAVNQRVWLKIH